MSHSYLMEKHLLKGPLKPNLQLLRILPRIRGWISRKNQNLNLHIAMPLTKTRTKIKIKRR